MSAPLDEHELSTLVSLLTRWANDEKLHDVVGRTCAQRVLADVMDQLYGPGPRG